MNFDRLKDLNDTNIQNAVVKQRHNELVQSNTRTQEAIIESVASLVGFLSNHTTKTEVINQLQEIGTPDVQNVVTALDSLHDTLKKHKNTDLSPITAVMQGVLEEVRQLPKTNPDIPEQKFIDYSKQLTALEKSIQTVEKAIKAQQLKVDAPIVNVPETVVNVEKPDLKPIEKSVKDSSKDVVKAVKGIKMPEFKTKSIEDLLKKTNKLLNDLPDYMPSGGGGGSSWIAVDDGGTPVPIQLDADGNLPINATGGSIAKATDAYGIQAVSDDGTYKYFFFEADNAAYYIMRKHKTNKTFTYTAGTGGYATVYQSPILGPSGSPTWGNRGTVF